MIPVPHPMSESADEFASLRTALELEIKPKGIVEQIYVDDIAAIVWEIQAPPPLQTSIITPASVPPLGDPGDRQKAID
jgi:hypothetical protein